MQMCRYANKKVITVLKNILHIKLQISTFAHLHISTLTTL